MSGEQHGREHVHSGWCNHGSCDEPAPKLCTPYCDRPCSDQCPAPSSTPTARDSGRYGEHPDGIGDGLHLIAEWMDEADALIDRVFSANGRERTNSGDQVQQDVRRLADWFRAHPDAAAGAWAYMKAGPLTAPRQPPHSSR